MEFWNSVKLMTTHSLSLSPFSKGALFSFVSAIQVLASVFGYLLYPTIYWHTIGIQWKYSPGTSFFVMASLYILSIPLTL